MSLWVRQVHSRQQGLACAEKVTAWVEGQGDAAAKRSIGSVRGEMRRLLADELAAIDAIVRGIVH